MWEIVPYIANTFYYCYKSGMMAKYKGLAKSSLCDAGVQILFVTLVACQRGTKKHMSIFHFFYFPCR